MINTAIFTIVTKSYMGLANVLMKSVADNSGLRAHGSFVFLADEIDDAAEIQPTAAHLIDCKTQVINNATLWNSAAFKYNVTEFCTFLKPFCIEYLYEQGFTNVIYFDPDIYVFNGLTPLVNNLTDHAAILTPHITQTDSCAGNPVFDDIAFANNGIFNLGFIAVNNSKKGRELVAWWKRMVTDNGYLEYSEGLATDQKWMDFAPAFLGDELLVKRGLGYNAGFWNIQERKITVAANTISVKERNNDNAPVQPLVFFHFSALYYPDIYNFSLSKSGVDFIKLFPDLEIIFSIYSKDLADNFNRYSALPYTYRAYDNGVPVSHLNRRLYRRLIETDKGPEGTINPFESKGPFYRTLLQNKLINTKAGSDTVTQKNIVSGGAGVNNKSRPVYLILRFLARLFGLKGVNKIISAGKSMGKEEAHWWWLQKDFNKNIKR